jgi:Helix-turn-helix domain
VTRGGEPLRFRWVDQVRADGSSVSANGRHIALELARYMDKEGRCFPSQERLVERTARSERHVRRGLGELEREGFLEVIRSTPNRYRARLKADNVSGLKPDKMSDLASKPAHMSGLKADKGPV